MERTDWPVVIACYKLEHLPSLNFYCRRDVVHCETLAQLADYLYWDAANWDIDVYLFLPTADWEVLKPQICAPFREVAHHYDMYHRIDLILVSNR